MKVCSFCQRCYEDSVASCTEEDHPALSGTRDGSCAMIAGYRLEVLLESGGRSETYRARHTNSGQSCFIKILADDEKNCEQFLHEAKIAAALFHPNVADVYETGALKSGEPYVVTEEADGQTLRDLLNNVGVPSLLTAIQVARQTAEALHAVHLKGLTHRAVNPANIVLTTDAEHRLMVKIQNFDFGGVNEQSIVSNKFLIESALDSLKYFAPEQFDGETAGARTDVYGLGIVFYEMLAGAPPFDAATAAGLIEKHRNQPPPDIKISNFELRMLLSHTLMEALRKQPQMRLNSANFFARQMRHIEQLATHTSTPPPAGTALPPPAAPEKYAAAAIGAAPAKPSQPFPVQPAAMETPKNDFRELTAPVVTAEIENAPVAGLKVESEPAVKLQVENHPSAAAEVENKSVAAKIENEPVNIFEVESEPVLDFKVKNEPAIAFKDESEPARHLEVEGESVISLKTRSEPVPAFKLVITVPDLPEIRENADLYSEEPVIENFVKDEIAPALRRSRLKSRKRRCRPKTVPPAVEKPDNKTIPAEAAEFEVFGTEPEEIALVQVESEEIKVIAVEFKPTVIEREQPQGDIPSEAEVLEIQLREQLIESAEVQPAMEFAWLGIMPGEDLSPGENSLPDESFSSVVTAVVAPTEPSTIQPSAAIETPDEIYKENIRPVTASIENEPVSTFKFESEHVPITGLEDSADDLPEIPNAFIDEPVIENLVEAAEVEPVQKITLPAAEIPENIPLPTVEPAEIKLVAVRAESTEIPVVQTEPEKITVVPVRSEPTKIEWDQPDDDIPSIEDVLEIQRQEQMIESAEVQPAAQFVTQDFSPAEDLSPEEDRLPDENLWAGVIPAATKAETPYIEPPAVMDTPREIYTENIRSITARVENEPRAVKFESESIAAEIKHEPVSPLKFEGEPIPDINPASNTDDLLELPDLLIAEPVIKNHLEVPKVAPVQKATQPAPDTTKSRSRPTVAPPKIKSDKVQAEPKAIPVVHAEPEEITVVSVRRKPTRIEWEKPATPQNILSDDKFLSQTSDEIEFLPTILGGVNKRRTIGPDRRDPIFSAYCDQSGGHYAIDYRSIIIGGGGLVALIVLFLVGDVFVSEDVRSASPSDAVVAITIPVQKSLPQAGRTNADSQVKQRALKNFEKPLPEDDVEDVNQVKPLLIKERAPLSREISQSSDVKAGGQNQTSKAATGSRKLEKIPSVSSTLVISSDNGKIKSKIEPANKSADKKSASNANRTANSTRPRIVKNPGP